jgi:hypothetical protein
MPIDELKKLFRLDRTEKADEDFNDAFNEDVTSDDESFDKRLEDFKDTMQSQDTAVPLLSEQKENGDDNTVVDTDKDTILNSVPKDDDFDTDDDLEIRSDEPDPFASLDEPDEPKKKEEEKPVIKAFQEKPDKPSTNKEATEETLEEHNTPEPDKENIKELMPTEDQTKGLVENSDSSKLWEESEDHNEIEEDDKEEPEEYSGDWLLKSPTSSLDEFYEAKASVIGHILPMGKVPFDRYRQELINAKVDMKSTYDQHDLSDRMHLIQEHKDRLKEIQLHISAHIFKWDRAVEMLRGKLYYYKPTKPASAFDGVIYDHMRDMEFYYADLKGINSSAEQVSRTLDGAYNCLSRQVTITMPGPNIERYIKKENKSSVQSEHQQPANYNKEREAGQTKEVKTVEEDSFDPTELEDFDEVESSDQSNKPKEKKKAVKTGLAALESLGKHCK